MKPVYLSALTLLLAGIVSYATTKAVQPTAPSSSTTEVTPKKSDESVYDRVIRTGKIRCGYIPYPPAMFLDPNTNEKSGVFYDFMNEVGRRLSLQVEWVQETGWGTFISDLKANRFDMMCSMAWTNSARAREVNHTKPLYYSGISAWVRPNDDRFNDGLDVLNSGKYSIAIVDGGTPATIAATDFPNAKLFSLPEITAVSDMILTVSTGKADVTFIEDYVAQEFLVNNPNSIKRVGESLRFYGNAMHLKKGENDLRLTINTVIEEILNSNFLTNLFKKYNIPENSYIIPLKPAEKN